jgi:hypothetical protein
MALPAVGPLRMRAANFWPGAWSGVTRWTSLAHERAVRNHRWRAGIEPVGRSQSLCQALEVRVHENLFLLSKDVALLAVAGGGNPHGIAVGAGRSEPQRRRLFAGFGMTGDALDVERRMGDDGWRAVVQAALGTDGRRRGQGCRLARCAMAGSAPRGGEQQDTPASLASVTHALTTRTAHFL